MAFVNMEEYSIILVLACFLQAVSITNCFPYLDSVVAPNFGLLITNASHIRHLLPDLQGVEVENLQVLDREDIHNYDYQQTSCQVVQIVHLLHHVGCQAKAIASLACSGSCSSYVQISTSKLWQHERSCSCCQQTSLQEATFTLDCPMLDPPYRKVKTYSPKDCLCRGCTDFGEENESETKELAERLTT